MDDIVIMVRATVTVTARGDLGLGPPTIENIIIVCMGLWFVSGVKSS